MTEPAHKAGNGGAEMRFRPVLHALTANPGVEMVDYAAGRQGLITMAQGQGDAPTPDFITDAAFQAAKNGKTFYGPPLGEDALREAISAYYARIYGLDVPASRVFVTASGTTAMNLSLATLLDKGDNVVAVTPIWKNLLGAVELTQASVTQVSLDYVDDAWRLDLDKLFSAVTPYTRVLMIVSPSNPTGWFAEEAELRAILDFARARGIWVIADEVYSRLIYDGRTRAPSFLDVSTPEDHLLVINSFSKSWAMTGWRLGWIVGPPEAADKIRDVALYNNLCPPTFPQYGAIAALEEGEGFLAEQIALWRANRDAMMAAFAAMPRVRLARPEATFYGFFRVEGEGDCITLAKRFVDEAGLLLSPGCAFGHACRSYIRMCFAVSRDRLDETMRRIVSVVGG
ncbi:MAG TPA: beta-eliminating lyase [Rhodospirillaceae bacterium]|jgi:aspartate aminotransferase|nr:pyridoxal phosphate-dependent aminotransferase [Alphaproteobacteria bacterium]HBH25873.1 beta-eliminating lyase [Rhodospirillaceae bacterium]